MRAQLQEPDADIGYLSFTPDSMTLLTSSQNHDIRCWEPTTGRILLTLEVGTGRNFAMLPRLLFDREGRLHTYHFWETSCRIWRTGREVTR